MGICHKVKQTKSQKWLATGLWAYPIFLTNEIPILKLPRISKGKVYTVHTILSGHMKQRARSTFIIGGLHTTF